MRVRVKVTSVDHGMLTRVPRTHAAGLPCIYCWEPMSVPTWDHVVPLSKGGPNVRQNLVVACRECNAEKADLLLAEFEGVLWSLDSEIAPRVRAFADWVMADWELADQQHYQSVVSDTWRDAARFGVGALPMQEWMQMYRGPLSKYVRESLPHRRKLRLISSDGRRVMGCM